MVAKKAKEEEIKEEKIVEEKTTEKKDKKAESKYAKQYKKEVEEKKVEIEKTNKKYKTSFVTFDDSPLSNIQYISSGDKDLNVVLSGKEDGGFARGRIVELYGPEGSGKTFILSKLYTECQKNGLRCAHYDSEGTYSKDFAKLHGVDPLKLDYTFEDKAEKIFEEIESLCKDNVYDVIGIDSLASLVTTTMIKAEMGAQNYSPLAGTIARCIPRLSSALKTSKTVLVLVNQLRDNVGVMYGPTEKTPGGRTVKFYATIRLEVRKDSQTKATRPDLFDGEDKAIGHVLKIKCTKNKTTDPFRSCEMDLMYKLHRPIIQIIKSGVETDVLKRYRNKNGEVYGKKIEFKGTPFIPAIKDDYEAILVWLKECGFLCEFLVKMDRDDFDEFIESGDITQEEVEKYLLNSDTEDPTEEIDSFEEDLDEDI